MDIHRLTPRGALLWLRESFSFTSSDGLSRVKRARLARQYEDALKLTPEQVERVRYWFEEQRKLKDND